MDKPHQWWPWSGADGSRCHAGLGHPLPLQVQGLLHFLALQVSFIIFLTYVVHPAWSVLASLFFFFATAGKSSSFPGELHPTCSLHPYLRHCLPGLLLVLPFLIQRGSSFIAHLWSHLYSLLGDTLALPPCCLPLFLAICPLRLCPRSTPVLTEVI